MAPRYQHDDCDACVYLGQFNEYDLYYCPGEPTVIARASSNGPDYFSGIIFGIFNSHRENHPLKEALIRALLMPDYRNKLNEYIMQYETGSQETAEKYNEILKIVFQRIKETA